MEAIGERNGGRIFPVVSGGGNTGLDWTPDDSAIVFTDSTSDSLWMVSVNPDTEVVGTPVLVRPGVVSAPVCSPDGTKLAFVTPGAIKVLDLATGVESFNVAGYAPSFSPDGLMIAFEGPGPVTKGRKTTWHPQICVANVDGTGIQRLTSQAWEYVNFPKWSANATEIAFWHRSNDVNSIRKLTLATGAISLVMKNGQTLDWAP
jgi:Tol biopolymer transport system component